MDGWHRPTARFHTVGRVDQVESDGPHWLAPAVNLPSASASGANAVVAEAQGERGGALRVDAE